MSDITMYDLLIQSLKDGVVIQYMLLKFIIQDTESGYSVEVPHHQSLASLLVGDR